MTTEATTAIAAKNGICQPGAEARKLNAAPLLNTSTRLKNGASARLSPGAKAASTASFGQVIQRRSPATREAEPAQRPRHSAAARPRRAGCSRSARTAPPRSRRRGSASSARTSRCSLALTSTLNAGPCSLVNRRTRRDQYKTQIVAQARQRLVDRTCAADVQFRRQRRADLLRFALFLESSWSRSRGTGAHCPRRRSRPDRVLGRASQCQTSSNTLCSASLLAQHLPGLLRGEAQDRRHQPHQALRDVPERGLRRAPRARIRAAGVEPVLEDVEVERRPVPPSRSPAASASRGGTGRPCSPRPRPPAGARSARARSGRSRSSAPPAPRAAPDRNRRCWRAGSAAYCGCAGSFRRRASGSRSRSSARPNSRRSPTHRRRISAPSVPATCCGAMPVPFDFDILRPSMSMTKPCVRIAL